MRPISSPGQVSARGRASAGGAPTGDVPRSELRWRAPDGLPAAAREALLGPGAPFEIVEEPVLGTRLPVFARRPPHLRALLEAGLAERGDRPFLVRDGEVTTLAEARRLTDRVAARLAGDHGVARGDRVAVVAANCPEHVIVTWATLSLGATAVLLNGWWTGAELAHGLELTEPVLVVGDAPRLRRLEDESSRAGPGNGPGGIGRQGGGGDRAPARLDITELVASAAGAGDDPGPPPADVDEDDPAVLVFTSGTTGRPRAAALSHRSFVQFAMATRLNAAIGAARAAAAPPDGAGPGPAAPAGQPATLAVSPFFHVSGLVPVLVSGPFLGVKLVFGPPGRWDEEQHLRLTAEHGITSWAGVPTQYWRLVEHPLAREVDLSSLRTVGSGGAPLPPELVRRVRELVPDVILNNGYGTSETAGLGTLASGPISAGFPASVGPPQPTVAVQVRGPGGEVLPEGEVGEVHLRSAATFLGYWRDEEATAAVLDADRWYATGDVGRIEGGELHLESRRQDLILRGGENVYPSRWSTG